MKKIIVFVIMSVLTSASPLLATTLACSGTVEVLSYHGYNSFMIQLSSMNTPVYFCNPETTWTVPGTNYTTGPQTCKMLYATFLSAKETGKPISNMYFDGDSVPDSCDTWASWSHANIRHFVY